MVQGGFEKREKDGVVWYAVSFLERTGLARAAFSTRIGGVSAGETATMNFSMKRRDTAENVRENYRRFCEAARFPAGGLVVSRQVHGVCVHEPSCAEVGRGVFDDAESVEADALITSRRGAVLVKHSADCVPVYILDTARPAAAMVHAGWRGTRQGIVGFAVRRMAEAYGTRPADCLAAIGPSIGPCCFEVGADVADLFEERYPGRGLVQNVRGATTVDLWRCNSFELLDAGIPEENIAVAGMCTACHTDVFYSHRREQGRTGAMVGMIELI